MRIPSPSPRAAAAGALVLAAALTLPHCGQALLTAPANSTLRIIANPMFIPAHGGVSVITVSVIEPAGTPVADGTVVQFFTTLGRIDEQGRTNDGVARVNLLATGLSGKAVVTAASGGAGGGPSPAPSASPSTRPGPTLLGVAEGVGHVDVTVAIGTAEPTRLVLAADPPRANVQQPSHIRAFVVDDNGNPVANVPVFFAVNPVTGTEFMESGGNPAFTDTNGIAEDVLRTTVPLTAAGRTVTVVANAAGLAPASLIVRIN